MSFMLTTNQIIDETKDVTRRNGWENLKPGDRLRAVEKAMGLKKGEKQRLLRDLRRDYDEQRNITATTDCGIDCNRLFAALRRDALRF